MNTVRQLKGLITEGKKLFAYDDNGAKVTWNAEDGGWEDVCGDCNKSWCEGGEYNEDNQWFCVDCYVTPSDSEDEDELCESCDADITETDKAYLEKMEGIGLADGRSGICCEKCFKEMAQDQLDNGGDASWRNAF